MKSVEGSDQLELQLAMAQVLPELRDLDSKRGGDLLGQIGAGNNEVLIFKTPSSVTSWSNPNSEVSFPQEWTFLTATREGWFFIKSLDNNKLRDGKSMKEAITYVLAESCQKNYRIEVTGTNVGLIGRDLFLPVYIKNEGHSCIYISSWGTNIGGSMGYLSRDVWLEEATDVKLAIDIMSTNLGRPLPPKRNISEEKMFIMGFNSFRELAGSLPEELVQSREQRERILRIRSSLEINQSLANLLS